MNTDATIPSHNAHPVDFYTALEGLNSYPEITYTRHDDYTATIYSRGHQLLIKYHADKWEADGDKIYLAGFHAIDEHGKQLTTKPYPIDGLYAYTLTWAGTLPTVPREIALRRQMLGLTLEELARALNTDAESLAQWEAGKTSGRSLADVLTELNHIEAYAAMRVHQMVQAVEKGEELSIPAGVELTYSTRFCKMLYTRATRQLLQLDDDIDIDDN